MMYLSVLMTTMVAIIAAQCEYQYCKQGWTMYGQACFRLYEQNKNWTEARLQCISENGHLAVIPDKATDDFLHKEFFSPNVKRSFWIGLNDRDNEGTFVWADSDVPVTYTGWYGKQPDNSYNHQNCGRLWNKVQGRWDDWMCYYKQYFLCQSKTTCVRRNKYLVIMV